MRRPLQKGDRVVYTGFAILLHQGGEHRAVAGTVIEVEERLHHHVRGSSLYLHVILDSAEKLVDEARAFYLESEYDPRIPF